MLGSPTQGSSATQHCLYSLDMQRNVDPGILGLLSWPISPGPLGHNDLFAPNRLNAEPSPVVERLPVTQLTPHWSGVALLAAPWVSNHLLAAGRKGHAAEGELIDVHQVSCCKLIIMTFQLANSISSNPQNWED